MDWIAPRAFDKLHLNLANWKLRPQCRSCVCYLKFNMVGFQHSFVLSWKRSQVAISQALPDKSDEITAPDNPQVTAGVWGDCMGSNYQETRLFHLSMAVLVPLVLCCANLWVFIQVSRLRDCRGQEKWPLFISNSHKAEKLHFSNFSNTSLSPVLQCQSGALGLQLPGWFGLGVPGLNWNSGICAFKMD